MFLRQLATAALSIVVVSAGAGCERSPSIDAGEWYHAYLEADEDAIIPFFLRLPEDCEADDATILNGEERLRAECRRGPVGFVVDFPVYGKQVETWFKPDGTLTGHWCQELADGREPILPLKARPVAGPDPETRFPETVEEESAPRAEIGGVWRVELAANGASRGVFAQDAAGVLTGTIEVPSEYGDLRFLAGNVRGSHFRLSTFDGQSASLVEGEIQPDGTVVGEWIRYDSRQRFVAHRDEDVALPDPLARIPFTPDVTLLELELLRDSKFDGRAVIVELFGTWCPNCNDHAPALVELHRKYNVQGLEILGLAFEYGFDADYKERRVREFRKRHGIEFDIVIADSTLDELASEALSGLGPIEGVPVTIFLNRDHTVHAIYSGFSGPATGEAHDRAKAQFEKLTAEILDGI